MKINLLMISFLFLSACQNAIQSANNSTQMQNLPQGQLSHIIGGVEVAENSAVSYGIVGIFDSQENAICTGSLIGANYVVTAAHCIGSNPSKMKIIFGINLNKIIDSKNQLLVNYYTRRVTDAKVYPTYVPEEQQTKETDWGDIAVIKFEGDLPKGYHPVQLLTDESLLKRGALVTVAGFGVSDVETTSIDAKKVKHLQDAIDSGEIVCTDDKYTDCFTVQMSGDGLLRQAHAPVSSVQETEFHLDESKGQGTCSGDSGGPAYITVDGQLQLVGATSRGSALCNDDGVYTNVVHYKQWIDETLPLLK